MQTACNALYLKRQAQESDYGHMRHAIQGFNESSPFF